MKDYKAYIQKAIDKLIDVVKSCQTKEQVRAGFKYLTLFEKKFDHGFLKQSASFNWCTGYAEGILHAKAEQLLKQ